MLNRKPILIFTLAIAMVALFAAVPAGAALCSKCSTDPEVDPPGTCADMLIVGSRADSNWTCRMTYYFDQNDTTWSITCCPTAKGKALQGASHGNIIWNRKCGGSEAYVASCYSEGANISYYPSGQGDSQGVGYPFLDTDSCKVDKNWGEKEFTVSLSALGEEVPVHDEYVDLKDHQLLFAIKAGQDRAVGYFTGPIGCLPEPCPEPYEPQASVIRFTKEMCKDVDGVEECTTCVMDAYIEPNGDLQDIVKISGDCAVATEDPQDVDTLQIEGGTAEEWPNGWFVYHASPGKYCYKEGGKWQCITY